MFGRKKSDELIGKLASSGKDGEIPLNETSEIDAPPLKPFTRKGAHVPPPVGKPPAAPFRPEIPRRGAEIPGSPRRPLDHQRPTEAEGKKLIVGREICLSGEITACDRLVVEGTVEATLSDARAIDIAESGLFKGTAEVDEADISGRFEGTLTAHKQLTIRASGRVIGAVRYGRIIIEGGGEVAGTVEVISGGSSRGSEG
jgi:cytoskeletal protein CcmA (bactofilin family)